MEIVEAHFQLGHTSTLKKWRHSYMEIVEAHFQLGHTSTLRKWRHSYMEIVEVYFQLGIPPCEKSGGISVWEL